MVGASDVDGSWPSYAPLYMTSLMTYRRQENSSVDLFGNIRIPSLEAILQSSGLTGNTSWQTVDLEQAVPYSSMLGIPLVGVPTAGNVSFNITSRYYAVDCHISKFIAETSAVLAFKNSSNMSVTFAIQVSDTLMSSSDATLVSFNLTSPNSLDFTHNVSFLACSLSPRDVESTVSCVDESCRVTAMRNLTVDLQNWEEDHRNMQNALMAIPKATIGAMQGSNLKSSLSELWLQQPEDAMKAIALYEYSNLSAVPLPTLSRNFEILLNTFWQSTYGAEYLSGNLSSTDLSAYDDITQDSELPISFNTSEATLISRTGEQYECDMLFAGLLLAISCLLFIAGLASLVLMLVTIAPDILGYVSSYTRDNPFAGAEKQASHLEGPERSKALREMSVTLGDVKGQEDTGYIALAATERTVPLQNGRWYW